MIFAKSVRGVDPVKFFDNDEGGAMFGLNRDAHQIAQEEMSRLVRKTVRGVGRELTRTVKVKL